MSVTSPCIKLCVLDDRFGLCLGCGRTLNEIGQWGSLSEVQRSTLLPAFPVRLAALETRAGRRKALEQRAAQISTTGAGAE